MSHTQDRGLLAVRRVRTAREHDSLVGLQHALAEGRRRAEQAERLRDQVAAAPAFDAGTGADFRRHAEGLTLLAQASRAADDAAATGVRVADEARLRWQRDRTGVRVVDLLLERRAAERAAERNRRETAELDDLAAVAWLRRRTEDTAVDEGDR